MLELAVQRKVIDVLGNLARETRVDSRKICNFAYTWANGRLPGPSEAAEILERAREDIKAGRYRPAKEVVADMRGAVDQFR